MNTPHLLFATDFGEHASEQLTEIAAVCKILSAEVTVCHVLTSVFKIWLKAGDLEHKAQQRLDHWAELLRQQGITVRGTELCLGNAADMLIKTANKLDVDCIVIGAGDQHVFLGSTAENVVRHASHSVWVHKAKSPALTTILVAVDMSEESAKALKTALSLAKTFSASLEVVTCIESPSGNMYAWGIDRINELYDVVKEEKGHKFHQFISEALAEDASSVKSTVLWGEPSETILQYSADCNADLLVLGGKGSSDLEHLVTGGTAVKIVRSASTSFLVVR